MCAAATALEASRLFGDDSLQELATQLGAGQALCQEESVRLIGTSGGRTYVLRGAQFAATEAEGVPPGWTRVVFEVDEIQTDASSRTIYRDSTDGRVDAVGSWIIERDGQFFLVLMRPDARILVRENDDFRELAPGSSLYSIQGATALASLPPAYVLPFPDEAGGYDAVFEPDTMSVSVAVADAREIFPRTYAVPGYDRDIRLRFPLVANGEGLLVGHGEIVESATPYPATDIAETPETLEVPGTARSCRLWAYLADDAGGVFVREAPVETGRPIAVLPAARRNPDEASQTFGTTVSVAGVSNGWFLIENARHPSEDYGPEDPEEQSPRGTGSPFRQAYGGRGWVEGSQLRVDIQSGNKLRAEASEGSAQSFDLVAGSDDGYPTVERFLDCEDGVVEVTVRQTDGTEGSGWIDFRSENSVLCENQATTCN